MCIQTVMDVNSATFCLNDLLHANLLKTRFKVQDICLSADEELTVEEKVEHVARHWHASSLTFKNFKSLGPVLFENSALHLLLESFEETQVLLQSLSVSKYGLPFKDTIDEHIANFTAFMELMEIWRGVQHVWWYVGVVFSSEDVGKQVCTRNACCMCGCVCVHVQYACLQFQRPFFTCMFKLVCVRVCGRVCVCTASSGGTAVSQGESDVHSAHATIVYASLCTAGP